MLVLNRHEVTALLDLDRLVAALAPAMAELSADRVSQAPRGIVSTGKGLLGVMPVALDSAAMLAAKLVTVFPQNDAVGLPSHQALIGVFDPETGTPLALMDGTCITALRTAAGSALATRLLARPDAAVLAIAGTGVQARSHALAIPCVRTIREIRVLGCDPVKSAQFAADITRESGIPAHAVSTFRQAADGADIVCAATHAVAPVVSGQWLAAGTHVNSVGLNPRGRELDDEAIAKSKIFVESRAAALALQNAGANDLVEPLRRGVISENGIHAEIGEVVSGTRTGRDSAGEITLYKSVGVAVQDAVAARLVLDAARERGWGAEIEI